MTQEMVAAIAHSVTAQDHRSAERMDRCCSVSRRKCRRGWRQSTLTGVSSTVHREGAVGPYNPSGGYEMADSGRPAKSKVPNTDGAAWAGAFLGIIILITGCASNAPDASEQTTASGDGTSATAADDYGPESEYDDIEMLSEQSDDYYGAIRFKKSMPKLDWPPPQASARLLLDRKDLDPNRELATLGDVADRLRKALRTAGYEDIGFYSVPEGFALVTRVEQMSKDGSPLPGSERFNPHIEPKWDSLWSYVRAVLFATRGYFRMYMILVTSAPIYSDDERLPFDASLHLASGGAIDLPDDMRAKPYTTGHRCAVLIYEFHQPTEDHEPNVNVPSTLSAWIHLERSGITIALEIAR